MNITEIKYRKLSNIGNYENETIEATATVSGEDPVVVMKELAQFVDDQLAILADKRNKAQAERVKKEREETRKRNPCCYCNKEFSHLCTHPDMRGVKECEDYEED